MVSFLVSMNLEKRVIDKKRYYHCTSFAGSATDFYLSMASEEEKHKTAVTPVAHVRYLKILTEAFFRTFGILAFFRLYQVPNGNYQTKAS